ncbi:hypothetical protein Leryth_025703 [Lithospermum erythrorhizon]|nr:hypothetical protein Leryth_025703 [Lithospermum erythrorhizon]
MYPFTHFVIHVFAHSGFNGAVSQLVNCNRNSSCIYVLFAYVAHPSLNLAQFCCWKLFGFQGKCIHQIIFENPNPVKHIDDEQNCQFASEIQRV